MWKNMELDSIFFHIIERSKTKSSMKYLLPLLLFISISYSGFGRIGMGEQYFETPGGHMICDCDGLENSVKNAPSIVGFEEQIPKIQEFYFYKNHIVGYNDSLHFIFNEKNNDLQLFKYEQDWYYQIELQELDPIITRWLDLSDSPEVWHVLLFMWFFLTIPLATIFIYLFFRWLIFSIKREKFNIFKGKYTKRFLLLLLILIWLLQKLFWIESI